MMNARMARRLGLVMLWSLSASSACLALWVPLGGVAHALAAPSGAGVIVPFLVVLYAPFIGLRIIAYGTPAFGLLFAIWAVLCRGRPTCDSPWNLAIFALLIALPASCLISGLFAQGPAEFSWPAFGQLLPFYLLVIWGGVLLPRWLIPLLTPGAFGDLQQVA